MTRKHDAQGVGAKSRADRSGGGGTAGPVGELAVGGPLSITHSRHQGGEDGFLERCRQGQLPRRRCAAGPPGQVIVQPPARRIQRVRAAQHPRADPGRKAHQSGIFSGRVGSEQRCHQDTRIVAGQQHPADGGVVHGIRDVGVREVRRAGRSDVEAGQERFQAVGAGAGHVRAFRRVTRASLTNRRLIVTDVSMARAIPAWSRSAT